MEKDKRTEFLTLLSPLVTVCTFTGSCACMVQQMSRPLRAFSNPRSAPRRIGVKTPFKSEPIESAAAVKRAVLTCVNPKCSPLPLWVNHI